MNYKQTWELDRVFPGGIQSEQLQEKLKTIQEDIHSYQVFLEAWKIGEDSSAGTLKSVLKKEEEIDKGLEQTASFVQMCHDSYMDDDHANVVMGQVMELDSEKQKVSNRFMKKVVAMKDEDWKRLLQDEELKKVSFALEEIRDQGQRLLSEEEEKLIAELNKDGLAAWSQLYDTIVSVMTLPFTDRDGKTTELSIGQAMNRMYADPDSQVREQLFEQWENAWENDAPLFTDTLNHLTGYRITLQRAHGRKDHLEEPLEFNRMSKETLDAMWKAVAANKQPFIDFLNQKANMLGKNQLAWQDVEAPIAIEESKPIQYTYDEACDFVISNFSSFGPKLADFAKYALTHRWVEAEDRPNKRPGGYCTSLPESKESRIFMTFTGSQTDVNTLAHELGHAFHSEVMKDLPELNKQYAMNVAETASTFAETIIGNAAIRQAQTKNDKLALLNAKLENATAMFLNIHARFLFEDAFYKERTEGIVSTQRLNELMTEAQKEAYEDCLTTYHPHFWASKLHFFIDDIPFYNFPYTFGYLFSLGIYAKSLEEPDGFEEKYIALLRDTGSMTVEQLAERHLNADLTKQEFWEAGIRLAAKDAETFIELTAD